MTLNGRCVSPMSERFGGRVALIAAGGALPGLAAAEAPHLLVSAIDGITEPALAARAAHSFSLGEWDARKSALRAAGVQHLVVLGYLRRPSSSQLTFDAGGAQLFARLAPKMLAGDDQILTALIGSIEEEGFHVIGAADVAPNLVAQAGQIGAIPAGPPVMDDLQRGMAVARALGAFDVGQACIVSAGLVLGLEAQEGTDELLGRVSRWRREHPDSARAGGVLVKMARPGQDLRLDMPVIGPQTVRGAKEAGLTAIGIEAGKGLLAPPVETRVMADAFGLALIGL